MNTWRERIIIDALPFDSIGASRIPPKPTDEIDIFDMRRSAVESRLAASRFAASPTDVVRPGPSCVFSHASVCD